MPALSALQRNPTLKEFANRLRAAGKPGKVVVVAVMRKLLRIMFAVLKSGRPFEVVSSLVHLVFLQKKVDKEAHYLIEVIGRRR